MPGNRIVTPHWFLVAITAAVPTLTATGCGSEPVTADGSPQGGINQTVAVVDPAEEKPATTAIVKLRPGARTKVLDKVGDRPFDKTFDDLWFEMDLNEPFRREMLTDAINGMAGQQIRIRGYILPTAQKRGLKQFVLVRDNQECCFGQGAALFDCILVEMAPGKTAEYSIRPVAVAGTFGIEEFIGPDDRYLAIYRLDAESVE